MITLAQTLSWLNQFDQSHIPPSTKPKLRDIFYMLKPEKQMDVEVYEMLLAARKSHDLLEYPELILNCTIAKAYRGQHNWARSNLREAAIRYNDMLDDHRKAVAMWMLGIIDWQLDENYSAISNWQTAYGVFKSFQTSFTQSLKEDFEDDADLDDKAKVSQKAEWYQERLVEMEVDLASTMEEAYTWLYIFRDEYSSLRMRALHLKDTILDLVKRKQFASAVPFLREMRALAESGSDSRERPELFTFSGLVYYQLGDYHNAAKMLRFARETFLPESHKKAIVTWMIGVLQWQTPIYHSEAATNWQWTIEAFQDLELAASQKDEKEKRNWYANKLKVLMECFEQMKQNKVS